MAQGRTARVIPTLLVSILALSACGLAAPSQGTTAAGEQQIQSAPLATQARVSDRLPVPGGSRSAVAKEEAVTPWDLPTGALYVNPVSGRREIIDPTVTRQAVLIGDSQAAGAAGVKTPDTWVSRGLASRGYKVRSLAVGGTGFVAKTPAAPNYPDAVENGSTVLPFGSPALVVVQGGGNDASLNASDADILDNAARLLKDLRASYPHAQFLFVGTLARGSANGGGRRTEVDTLLASFAQSNGLNFVSTGDWVTRYGVGGKMADGAHLTAEGHNVIGGVLSDKLKSLGLDGPGAR